MVKSTSEVLNFGLGGARFRIFVLFVPNCGFSSVNMRTIIQLLFFCFIAFGIVASQNEDELQIPVEEDNQFPPESHIEGSGEGMSEQPVDIAQATSQPFDIESRVLEDSIDQTTPAKDVTQTAKENINPLADISVKDENVNDITTNDLADISHNGTNNDYPHTPGNSNVEEDNIQPKKEEAAFSTSTKKIEDISSHLNDSEGLQSFGMEAPEGGDELQIPEEEDNLFPPESRNDTIITMQKGATERPNEQTVDSAQVTSPPIIEDIESNDHKDYFNLTTPLEDLNSCPSPCVCNTEGEEFVVDCSGYGLSTFPTSINARATVLNLQNNKLIEIPIIISSLKNLKVLNVDKNGIMELVPGSVSELPELEKLIISNNRLIEYPQDLKNAFGLSKLQELDLGGNDIRSTLTAELFSNFKSLKKVTLPVSNSNLLQSLCGSLKDSLETVCTGTCLESSYECPDVSQTIDEALIETSTQAFMPPEENTDDVFNNISPEKKNGDQQQTTVNTEDLNAADRVKENKLPKHDTIESSANSPINLDDLSLQSRGKELLRTASEVSPLSAIVVAPKETPTDNEAAVKVGATTTSDTQTGGVDKTVIGLVIAGMIVVIAGITIKKNWNSITKRFRSTPRTTERVSNGVNGAPPEEVPLQDKSPV